MRTGPSSLESPVRRHGSRWQGNFTRGRALVIVAATIILVALPPLTRARVRGPMASSGGDLSILFIGLTNAPVPTTPMLAISRAHRDPYALFAVTNTSNHKEIEFFTVGAEKRDGSLWHPFVPAVGGSTNYWRGVAGTRFLAPGAGCVVAAPWPTGLAATNGWRLRLSVAIAPSRLLKAANNAFGAEFFQPRCLQMMPTPPVVPLAASGTAPY